MYAYALTFIYNIFQYKYIIYFSIFSTYIQYTEKYAAQCVF